MLQRLVEFCGNSTPEWCKNKSDQEAFIKEVTPLVREILNIDAKDASKPISTGRIYEAGVAHMLSSHCKYTTKAGSRQAIQTLDECFAKLCIAPLPGVPKEAPTSIRPDGYIEEAVGILSRGPVEVKGFMFHQQGTADEKNMAIDKKYLSFPYDADERLTVVLCGKMTKVNARLAKENEIYQEFRKGVHIPYLGLRATFEMWEQARIGTIIPFDKLVDVVKGTSTTASQTNVNSKGRRARTQEQAGASK